MPNLIAPKRHTDNYGSGDFGASRGSRKHNGQDFLAAAGSLCLSDVDGKVTKYGYPYKKHPEYRYVQVTTADDYNVRYFYVQPTDRLELKNTVKKGGILGIVQDIEIIYPNGMGNHIHFEVKKDGKFIEPNKYLANLS